MKPKNKFQTEVFLASKTLPSITTKQKEFAFKHCFEHIGRRNAKGLITCCECGKTFKGDGELVDSLLGATCPHCATKLKVQTTRKRVFKETEYFCIVTTSGKFQVLRFFLVKAYFKAGKKAEYSISEAVQRWIAPDGKYATIAKIRHMSFYCDLWDLNSPMEIRPERMLYNISPICIYPKMKLVPEIRRSGFDGNFYRLSPFDLFHTLLLDSRAETLLKAGQTNLLRYFANDNFSKIDSYWASIKICIRNGYIVGDASLWRDYIDLIRIFAKDLLNAKYVCPKDLKAEHDLYVRKKKEKDERELREKAEQKALKAESAFREMKSRFFGIHFTDGEIQVRVLESVKEFKQEDEAMKHCVFTNAYYMKPDSLILSATYGDKRIETIEFSLSKMQVIQSRGVCNTNTEYHDRIINLVNKNRRIIGKRLAA